MAYSSEQWELAKALFETGSSLAEIAKETKIKDRSWIGKRATAEGWIKNKNATVIEKKVQYIQLGSEIKKENATLSPTALAVVDDIVDKRTADIKRFDSMQNEIAATSIEYLREQRQNKTLVAQDLTAVSSAISKIRNDVIPVDKSAVNVQINNQQNTAVTPSINTKSWLNEMIGKLNAIE